MKQPWLCITESEKKKYDPFASVAVEFCLRHTDWICKQHIGIPTMNTYLVLHTPGGPKRFASSEEKFQCHSFCSLFRFFSPYEVPARSVLLLRRNIVVVRVRGSGGSLPLSFAGLLWSIYKPAGVFACGRHKKI